MGKEIGYFGVKTDLMIEVSQDGSFGFYIADKFERFIKSKVSEVIGETQGIHNQ